MTSAADFCLFHKCDWEREIEIDPLGRPKLQELTSYIVKGERLRAIPNLLTPLSPDGDTAELNFGNYVGTAELYDREIRVESKKISSEQFKQVLNDISEEISNLPFDFNTPVSLAFERSSPHHPDILYQSFAYLRQITLYDKPCLSDCFGVIEGNPHRTTIMVTVDEDLSKARGIKPDVVFSAISRPQFLIRAQEGDRAFELPCAMQPHYDPACRFIPTTISDEHIEVTYDNPENRFVKAFLLQAIRICSHFKSLLDKHLLETGSTFYGHDVREELRLVTNALAAMRQAAFLVDVGELGILPASSQVLQRAEGYRQFFTHFHKLALASKFPIDGHSLGQIIEGKDVATLYEYWCFFAMVRILRKLLDRPVKATAGTRGTFGVFLAYNISVDFGDGVQLQFNKSYRGNSNKSYSVSLRPDITLQVGNRLHIFDAKFKYDKLTFVEESSSGESDLEILENEEEVQQRFKLGDLYKMHTYKDAIVDAKDVWILYPGNEFRFFEEGRGRVEQPDDIGTLMGVGAIPLKPLGHTGLLESIITRALG